MKKTYKTKYEYWRERCELAESILDDVVVKDELVYPAYKEAYNKWEQFKNEYL